MSEAEVKYNGGELTGFDSARVNCIGHYKTDMKKHVALVQQYYQGYQKNFSQVDGSLIKVVEEL